MIGARQSSPCITFTILGSGSTVFMKGPSMVWKNTSGCNAVFLAAALASSSSSVFFCSFDILDCEPLGVILHSPDGG
jgi:hypothetical protein